MEFFSEHSRFLDSSIVGNWPLRLNTRYEAIIASNRDIIKGARVLDLASHDGRWTFAAIEAGARLVVGVEVRPELVDVARKNMAALGVSDEKYRFESGDIFERQDIFEQKFDVVLCLGFLYHTTRHTELFGLIRKTNANWVIIDTVVTPEQGSYTRIHAEETNHPANGSDEQGVRNGNILVAIPTPGALVLILKHFGYSVARYDWLGLISRWNVRPDKTGFPRAESPICDYARGERGTFLATQTTSPPRDGWSVTDLLDTNASDRLSSKPPACATSLRQERDRAVAELTDVLNSRSWRITAPIRALSMKLRRLIGGPGTGNRAGAPQAD